MTSAQDGRLPDQVLRGDYHDILPANSFTAQRLKHASAHHLHLTSRRVFIGPIPETWIADHQKSWANFRPRALTYSSKSAAFDAVKSVPELRALAGIDSSRKGDQTSVIGLPRSTDIDSNVNVPDVERPADTSSTNQISSETGTGKKGRPTVLSPSDSYDSTGLESYITAPTRPRGAKSFVTAHEALDTTNRDSESAQKDKAKAKQTQLGEAEGSVAVQMRGEGTGDESLRRNGSTESTQALLTRDERSAQAQLPTKSRVHVRESAKLGEVSASGRQPNYSNVLSEVLPEAYEDEDEAEVTQMEPIRRGKVRFSLSKNVTSNGDRLRDRVSAAKEKVIEESRKAKAEPGQLLKAERMLVRIDVSKHDIPTDYSEKHSAKAETRVLETWKEYMVTCRKGSDHTDFVLHMAKTRVVPLLTSERTSKRIAHQITLKPLLTKVNLFSSLDKTIVVWDAEGKTTKIFILRPRSSTSSIEWLTFFNLLLGYKVPDTLRISVPDLDVILEVFNPLKESDTPEDNVAELADSVTPEGDTSKLSNNGHIAKRIITRALKILEDSEFQDVLNAWQERDERLGLVWRQYDRLEWIHGVSEQHMYSALAMQKTHELEIRPKMHYPTSASIEESSHEQLEEPEPIEGFLVLQTSQKGRESLMGKNYFKKLYFSTHNNLLCFSTPGKAVPPKPPQLKQALQGGKPKAKVLAEKIPLIYAVDPYPYQNGKIGWLYDANPQEIKELDHHAFEESERSLHLLLEAEGYINLCHIKHVRKFKPRKDGELEANDHQHDDSENEDESATGTSTNKHDIQRSFVLHLTNGLTVRLQAYDQTARKEWVKRLRALSEYWKHRTAGDVDFLKEVRQQNLSSLGIDEEMESIIGQTAEKWEVSKSVASPELFHMCGISYCRQITMSGVLYRKPRMHSSFRKCMAILCHGKLIIFQATLRSYSGRERLHTLHERQEVIDLKDSYIYSGSLTEDDLLYQNKTFDSNHPGHNALPRVYCGDNWTSIDEDSTTCFVIWRGRRKSFFKADTGEGAGTLMSQMRYVSTLGVPGRSMVFKTRSRAERDHWVTNVSMEIERQQRTEDIRIVASK